MKFFLMFRSTHERKVAEMEAAILDLHGQSDRMQAEIFELKAQLHKAQKNDHHDPKTGRFVKADT